MEFFKPKTVNLRIQGINKYLEYLGKEKLQLNLTMQRHLQNYNRDSLLEIRISI